MKNYILQNKEANKLQILIALFLFLGSLLISALGHPVFIITFIFPFLILTKKEGAEIDCENRTYRYYQELYGRRKGKWKNIPHSAEVVILTKSGKNKTTGTAMTATLEISGVYYELYLMNQAHTKRWYLYSSEDKNEIKRIQNDLAISLGIQANKYEPRTK